MSLDAVGALSGVRDGYRDELLRLLRQRSVGEDSAAECFERVVDLRRKFLPASGDLGCGRVIHRLAHPSVRIRRGMLGCCGARHDALLRSGPEAGTGPSGRHLFRSRHGMAGYLAASAVHAKSRARTGQSHRTRRAKIRTSVLPSIGKRSALALISLPSALSAQTLPTGPSAGSPLLRLPAPIAVRGPTDFTPAAGRRA